MKKIPPSVFAALAAVLVCFALNVQALTVGVLKGVALLGQPLEVAATVQLAQEDDASAVCAQAAVSYGDVLQPAAQTVVTVEPDTQSRRVLARISSSGLVNEPVVTVELKVGCAQKITRRFVLLVQPGEESPATATNTPSAVVARLPSALGVLPVGPAATDTLPAKPSGTAASAVPRKQAATQAIKANRTPATSEKRVRESTAKNVAASLHIEAVDDLKRRIEAVAQWQAAQAAAPQPQAHSASLDLLRRDLKLLEAVTLKNQKSIDAVANALEVSEAQHATPALVYGLLALVVSAMAGLGYLLLKAGSGGQPSAPWWGTDSEAQTQMPVTANPLAAKPLAPGLDAEFRASVVADPIPDVVLDVVPDAATGAMFGATSGAVPGGASGTVSEGQINPIASPKRADKRDFAQSGSASLRAFNTKEMLDVRQQAEFFMALGQHDDAIKVLEQSNLESKESDPLILLDLLKILHTLSRRAEFDQYRSEFNLLFTGIVPSYANFLHQGKSLESYADIVQQIGRLWPSDDAMDYIEQCLVRTPEDDPLQGFDLEAFQDLLVLHGILRRLDAEVDSVLAPFSASRSMAAVLAVEANDRAFATDGAGNSDMVAQPEFLPELSVPSTANLDLDLSDNYGSNLMDFDINEIGFPEKPKS